MRFARYRTAIPDAPGNRSGFATSSPGTAAVEGEARCSPAEGASMEELRVMSRPDSERI